MSNELSVSKRVNKNFRKNIITYKQISKIVLRNRAIQNVSSLLKEPPDGAAFLTVTVLVNPKTNFPVHGGEYSLGSLF